VGTGSLSLG